MFSTQLKILTYPAILSHRHSTTVSLENYPLYSVDFVVLSFRSDRVLEMIFLYGCDLVYIFTYIVGDDGDFEFYTSYHNASAFL